MTDELRRRSVRDVEQTSARPVPREFHPGEWVITIILIIGLLAWIMLR